MTTLFIGPVGLIKKLCLMIILKNKLLFLTLKFNVEKTFEVIISKVIHKLRGNVIEVQKKCLIG